MNNPFGLMAFPMFFYREWYEKDVKPHLDPEVRQKVAMRISDLTLEKAIWMDRDTNYIEKFPELAPYSHTGTISGLQLVAVMECVVKELHPEAKL